MTQPTVGRIVHYVSYGSADGRYQSTCRAAIVTEVHSNDSVGLSVHNPTGLFFDRNCRLSDEHTGGTWHWPCVYVAVPELGNPNTESVPAGHAPTDTGE